MNATRKNSIVLGLIFLMISMHMGNWAGYAWCMARAGSSETAYRDCGCDVYLLSTPGLAESDSSLRHGGFRTVVIEGMPEPLIGLSSFLQEITQRGFQSPSARYADPFPDPLFHPPGTLI